MISLFLIAIFALSTSHANANERYCLVKKTLLKSQRKHVSHGFPGKRFDWLFGKRNKRVS